MSATWKRSDREMPEDYVGEYVVWTPRKRGDWRDSYEVWSLAELREAKEKGRSVWYQKLTPPEGVAPELAWAMEKVGD